MQNRRHINFVFNDFHKFGSDMACRNLVQNKTSTTAEKKLTYL